MDVMVFKRVSKLRDNLNGVVVRHSVRSCPEGAIVPMHRDHGRNNWEDPEYQGYESFYTIKLPVEWPINAGGKEKPINDATTVACSDQVDVIGISGGVLGGNPGDQL